jgi:hypothetical protein
MATGDQRSPHGEAFMRALALRPMTFDDLVATVARDGGSSTEVMTWLAIARESRVVEPIPHEAGRQRFRLGRRGEKIVRNDPRTAVRS